MRSHSFRTSGRPAWARLIPCYAFVAPVGAVAADTLRLRRALSPAALVLAGLVGLGMLGCSAGIRWQGFVFDPVYAKSREENKLTFVFFSNWYAIECTEFEENVLKQPVVRDLDSAPEPAVRGGDPSAGVEVERLLATLPPADRFVLLMLDGEGWSVAEIAAKLGWSRVNVKVRAHRARKRLRELLERGLER